MLRLPAYCRGRYENMNCEFFYDNANGIIYIEKLETTEFI
jgi:hypothetical protein